MPGRGLAGVKLELRLNPAEDSTRKQRSMKRIFKKNCCVYVFSGRSQGCRHSHHMLVIVAA